MQQQAPLPMDELWITQRQNANQVVIACQVYAEQNGGFPEPLTDALSIMGHDPAKQALMRPFFSFVDPAGGSISQPWLYFPSARQNSSDLLLASPGSTDAKRVVILADGGGDVISEVEFVRRYPLAAK